MMSSFRTYILSGIRYAASTRVKGQVSPGATSSIEFTASVQPLTGKEKLALPEGVRENATYRLYTDYELKTADESGNKKADRVTIFSKTYEIIIVEIWQNKVIPHYKAIASLIDA